MSAEKCMVCDETVNDEDEISYAAGDGVWFHNHCFKCSQCDEHLLENNYSLSDGILYCKPHFDERVKNNRRLPRGVSLPKPSELNSSCKLSSIFFKAQSKRVASRLPPSERRKAPQIKSDANVDATYSSGVLTTIADGQLDQITLMNLIMTNPTLHGLSTEVSHQSQIDSQDFFKSMLQQLTQNPDMMIAITQLCQQMNDNQDKGNMFAHMSCSNDNIDMPLVFQHMMPLLSQVANSRLPEDNRLKKHERHRRCYSDSSSINCLSLDCQMSIKEAVQKIEDGYSALDIFASVVESAALFNDNAYDVYGLAELCSEEELAEEFMVMLKRDVCRRLGKRFDRCTSIY